MAFFGHFVAKNAVFFGDGGSETLDNLLPKIAKHVFLTPAPSKLWCTLFPLNIWIYVSV